MEICSGAPQKQTVLVTFSKMSVFCAVLWPGFLYVHVCMYSRMYNLVQWRHVPARLRLRLHELHSQKCWFSGFYCMCTYVCIIWYRKIHMETCSGAPQTQTADPDCMSYILKIVGFPCSFMFLLYVCVYKWCTHNDIKHKHICTCVKMLVFSAIMFLLYVYVCIHVSIYVRMYSTSYMQTWSVWGYNRYMYVYTYVYTSI
jgi:hypothetical protein